MIKSISEKPKELSIDLTGPEGNAYVLMGYAQKFAKQLGMDASEIEQLLQDMMSSDYEHLVSVFDKHFGKFVTLYR